MGTALQSNPEAKQVEGHLDQYQRPSCRPIESPDELRNLLGPSATQLLQVLNQL
jgi:hypothetical protein